MLPDSNPDFPLHLEHSIVPCNCNNQHPKGPCKWWSQKLQLYLLHSKSTSAHRSQGCRSMEGDPRHSCPPFFLSQLRKWPWKSKVISSLPMALNITIENQVSSLAACALASKAHCLVGSSIMKWSEPELRVRGFKLHILDLHLTSSKILGKSHTFSES